MAEECCILIRTGYRQDIEVKLSVEQAREALSKTSVDII
jgi:hypothetical protein